MHYSLEICERAPGEVRLLVAGEVDMDVAPSLLDSILCAALSYGGHPITVDLGGVTFMDSAGLAALLEAHRRLLAQDQALVIEGVDGRIRRIMELAGVADHLGVSHASATG